MRTFKNELHGKLELTFHKQKAHSNRNMNSISMRVIDFNNNISNLSLFYFFIWMYWEFTDKYIDCVISINCLFDIQSLIDRI